MVIKSVIIHRNLDIIVDCHASYFVKVIKKAIKNLSVFSMKKCESVMEI